MAASKCSTMIALAALALLAGRAGRGAQVADSVGELPRYRLQVGQELIYHGSSEFKYSQGKHGTRDTWRVWVVGQNSDGAWRLVIRHGSLFFQERDNERVKSSPAREAPDDTTFAWCDFYPDGRIVENESFGFRMQLAQLFPKLPADRAEFERGWTSRDTRMDESAVCRMLPAPAAGQVAFEVVRESPMNAIYGSEQKFDVTFDRERGLPEKIDSTYRQTYGFDGTGTGSTELVEVNTRPAEWRRAFADETQRFFAAREAIEALEHRKDLPPGDLKTELDSAIAKLKSVAETLETPELKKLAEEQLRRQEQSVQYVIKAAEERLALLGKPSDDWSTTDLEGKSHALTDYRGKVVILDFWYRGCGWCIRAMPQMKEVAAHFKDQPVVVFGMNTDRKEEDALFVVEKMGLNYANLKAVGLPEKYHVRGFPTLIILDQQGVIRDVHVGYSPMLRDEVVRSVNQLLNAAP